MEVTEKFPYQGMVLSSILRDISIVGRRQMLCRRSHGFIIKLKGATEYCFEDKTWLLSEGQILFVEKGSSYYIREITPGYSYVVNFEIYEAFSQDMTRLPMPVGLDIGPDAEKMYRFWQKGNVYGALSCLYTLLDKTVSSTAGYVSARDRQLLEPVTSYLTDRLTDPELNLEKLSDLSGVSDAYLRRVFKRSYGVSPAGYVIRERIRLACRMLVSGEEQSISRIASAVGYRDALYFSRVFKKQMGVSPTDYRYEHTDDLF